MSPVRCLRRFQDRCPVKNRAGRQPFYQNAAYKADLSPAVRCPLYMLGHYACRVIKKFVVYSGALKICGWIGLTSLIAHPSITMGQDCAMATAWSIFSAQIRS